MTQVLFLVGIIALFVIAKFVIFALLKRSGDAGESNGSGEE